MRTCQNCSYKWSWKETFKILFKNKKKCTNCMELQYISAKTRKRNSLLGAPIGLLILLGGFNVHFSVITGLMFLTFIIVLAVAPFLCELSNEEEALW
ncbi:TIGR04104 family putative zinc finger protein [Virgibacillus flavescens]|uniref:TIGR04104 family putative zinc finger protein n=1 Tax=Virgibacillus flavescens TaxID=1611422 RepID=UPI003D333478